MSKMASPDGAPGKSKALLSFVILVFFTNLGILALLGVLVSQAFVVNDKLHTGDATVIAHIAEDILPVSLVTMPSPVYVNVMNTPTVTVRADVS
ncbi:uncharacterized protein BJX67DRAFT_359011 [Aspergillus lucknowensis]|uniref:Uncharacterized protein n=1 Tax=Aspergillus lucknowensis TaxID=176173 RepID=A0ABR4LPB8_9EURO